MIRYVKALADVASKPLKVSQRPIHLQIEPTDACNLDCSFCSRSKVIEKPRLMSLEEFQKIIDTIRPKKITLNGIGEPLLNPGIFDMIAYAKSHGASVNTTSNLTKLDEGKAEKLIQSRLDLIDVSIDSATRETYQLVRGQDFFEQIRGGVRLLLQVKQRSGSRKPYVRISFLIHKSNLHEAVSFIELAHDLGVDVAFYQILALTALYERKERLIAGIPYEQVEHVLQEGQARARQLGVKTNLGRLLNELPEHWEKYGTTDTHGRLCSMPWFSAYISANGSVRPCCRFAPVPIDMGGSMLEKEFDGIWNSDEYAQFRAALKAGERPTRICSECVPEGLRDIVRRVPYSPGFFIE